MNKNESIKFKAKEKKLGSKKVKSYLLFVYIILPVLFFVSILLIKAEVGDFLFVFVLIIIILMLYIGYYFICKAIDKKAWQLRQERIKKSKAAREN